MIPRFRHRNLYGSQGKHRLEEFGHLPNTTSTCSSPQLGWYLNYESSADTNPIVIDTMDDIAGDPPNRKIGLSGYKFHPMTRTQVREEGGGAVGWEVRYISKTCEGTVGEHQHGVRRVAQSNLGRRWSNLIFPMNGERLDYSRTPYPYAEVDRLRGLAETACLAQRGKYGESNLYESLAEVDKTIGMLKDLFDRARRIQDIAFFGKKGTSRRRQLTNEAAGQYLSTRYGFMPTVSDIFSILKALEKPLGRILKTTRCRERWSSKQTTQLPDINDSGHVGFKRTYTIDQDVVVTAISLDSTELTILKALGLSFKDLASLPWELVSLSFVADWVANIGDCISAIAPNIGTSNVGSCVVIEWRCVEETALSGAYTLQPTQTVLMSSQLPPPYMRVITSKQRIVGLNGPRLQWRTDFKFDSVVRALDAIALFTAQTSKVQADLKPTAMEEILRLRRRNPSQRGRRSAEDYRNLN